MQTNAGRDEARSKKRGCLKWAAGVLVALVLLSLLGLVALWQGLSSWDPEESPWEHLPPRTLWAVHVHDVGAMGKAVFRDKGVRALIESLYSESASDSDWRSMLPVNALQFYDYFGFLHRAVAPNIIVAGATDRDPEAAFLITHPPAWMRFLMTWSGEKLDDIAAAESGEGEPSNYFAEKDGWLISSYHREAVREVLDNWDSAAFPLGPDSGRTDAHAFAAARAKVQEPPASSNAAAAPPPPFHFTLGDPFAAAAVPAAPKPVPANPALRLILLPAKEGWDIQGEAGMRDGFGAENGADDHLADVVARTLGGRVPALSPPSGQNVVVLAALDEGVRAELQNEVERLTPANVSASAHPVRALGARLVKDDWLGRAGNGWVFRAAAPAVERGNLPYPVLPVVSAGWTIRDGVGLEGASAAFGGTLRQWLDAVRAPGGPLPLQHLRSAFSLRPDGENGGELSVPPVAFGSARPAWRFIEDSGRPMGWLASDPSGLPDGSEGAGAALTELKQPDAGHASLAGGWRLDGKFISGVTDWVADRLEMLTNSGMKMEFAGTGDLRELVPVAAQVMGHFPKGSFAADVDVERKRAAFTARILHGVP